jgi:serine protease Do
VDHSGQVPPLVAAVKPGERAELAIWRERAEKRLTVKVDELEEERTARVLDVGGEEGGRLGLAVRPLSGAERRQAETSGRLLVEEVEGPAAMAGVEPGDILLAVNGRQVGTVRELRDAVETSGDTVALLIQRGEAQIYVPVRLG